MTTPHSKGFSRTASKRARSEDSQHSLTPVPASKASKKEETHHITSIPAFLRQSGAGKLLKDMQIYATRISNVLKYPPDIHSKFEDLEWKQQFRIAQGRNDPNSKWVQNVTLQARLRNRYMNVEPWEKSRIHLKVREGKCDYINASPISLRDPRSGVETNYIATQVFCGLSKFRHASC